MAKKAKFTIEFECDLDGVPGWGHSIEDWINLAKREFERQSHYNTKATVISQSVTGKFWSKEIK